MNDHQRRSVVLVLTVAITPSACSGSGNAVTPGVPNSVLYVPGTSLAWDRILSNRLAEADRDLLKRAVNNTPRAVRSSLTEGTAIFVIEADANSETVHPSRPELADALKQYRADSQGRGFATSTSGDVLPVPHINIDNAVNPAFNNNTGPYRRILSVPGYQNVTATLTPPCNNLMQGKDSVVMYTGGYGSTGVGQFEAGINNVVTGNHQTDFVPYVRGLGVYYYATTKPPNNVSEFGVMPYYFICGQVWINFNATGGCVDKAHKTFTHADPPCGSNMDQWEQFSFDSCYAMVFVGNQYLCNPNPNSPEVLIIYIVYGQTGGWTYSCKTCQVQRLTTIAQRVPSNDGSITGQSRWEQVALAGLGTGHSWDQQSTQSCSSFPSGPACAVSTPPQKTVVFVLDPVLNDPPGTFEYNIEDDWISIP